MVDDSITGNLRAYGSARMNAPPEANTEYSRGSEASQPFQPPPTSTARGRGSAVLGVALTAALGALLILVSQFTALYHVHVATSSAAIKTVGTGANHAWAPIPIALLAGALAFAVYRKGSRTALVALIGARRRHAPDRAARRPARRSRHRHRRVRRLTVRGGHVDTERGAVHGDARSGTAADQRRHRADAARSAEATTARVRAGPDARGPRPRPAGGWSCGARKNRPGPKSLLNRSLLLQHYWSAS